MKKFNLAAIVMATLLMVSCQKENSVGNTNNTPVVYANVNYGSDPLQNMDIYLPGGRSVAATKVMIMVHGGAWASGDKAELNQFVDTFKRRLPGYALFNINYRLSAAPNNLFPTQENDVKAAIDFIYSKADQYAISNKYALIGASAGGHLALLQAYKYGNLVKPKAVISLSGPTDLNDMYNNPAGGNPTVSAFLASVIGKTPAQDPALYTNSSPVNFVTAAAPPTLLFYGDVDPLVTPQQAVLLRNKLQAAGVAQQYVLYNGSAHVDTWNNAVLFDCFEKTQAFLTLHVQ